MPELTKRSFTSGEITPSLHDRVDLTKYATGLAACHGFIVKPQGGVFNRSGFSFIGGVSDNSSNVKLIEFEFNTEQTYILVFEHLKIRFIQNGEYILDENSEIYEIDSPYSSEDLGELYHVQSADVMTLTRLGYNARNLIRFGNTDWRISEEQYESEIEIPTWSDSSNLTIASFEVTEFANSDPVVTVGTTTSHGLSANQGITFDLAGGTITRFTEEFDEALGNIQVPDNSQPPLSNLNSQSFRITPITTTSFTTTISRSENDDLDFREFTSGSITTGGLSTVGDSDGGGSFSKTYSYVVSAVVNGFESLPSPSRSITVKSLSQTYGVTLSWSSVADVDYYRVYKETSDGTGVYGWIGDANNSTFSDFNIAPLTSDSPLQDGNPFTDGNNPSVVGYYQQRKIFANTSSNPQTFYSSKTADYNSFRSSRPSRDDDAIEFTIASNQLNEIRHIVSLNSLIMLTSGGEWLVTEGQDKVLSPSTIGVRVQSYNGSSKVKPEIINDTVLYVQDKSSRIRNLGYEFSSDSYKGNDLSIMARHLFEGYELIDIAYADEPHGVLWCVRNDGMLLGLTYQREHDVWGWHVHSTDGSFESIATTSEGNEDVLYAVVRREVDGQVVKYVERLNTRLINDAVSGCFLDSSLTYTDNTTGLITGLDHLEGKNVVAVVDGNVVKNLTVINGGVSVPEPRSPGENRIVHVGLPYEQYIDTLDIDSTSESVKGKVISVSKVLISFNRSRGGFISVRESDTSFLPAREIKPRFQSDNYDTISLKSYIDEVFMESTWAKSGGIRIAQKDPLPMEILSVIPEFSIGSS